VDDEVEAFLVFAFARFHRINMLKAQLLAAKLNSIRFPGFADAYLPSGQKVGDVIGQADAILNDIANGVPHSKQEITHVKDLLDTVNNNGHKHTLSTCPPNH
jgi:hypothetical protein